MSHFNILPGFRLVTCEYALTDTWIFPEHRFFEWESKDEPFCRKYAIGHPGQRIPCMYLIGDTLVCHPDVLHQLPSLIASLNNNPISP